MHTVVQSLNPLYNNLKASELKLGTLHSKFEIRHSLLAFSCASARTSHPALRRAAPPPLQTHKEKLPLQHTFMYCMASVQQEYVVLEFISPRNSKIVSLNLP